MVLLRESVNGHQHLRAGGQLISWLVATRKRGGWPVDLPSEAVSLHLDECHVPAVVGATLESPGRNAGG